MSHNQSFTGDPIELSAGPLQMRLDTQTGFLRRIRLGDLEILRGIYVAVRDRNWRTVPPSLSDVRIESGDGFRITFTARCRLEEIDFQWSGEITATAEGCIRYSMEGKALRTFQRNRIGFCVLHPVRECAGEPCTLTRSDGSQLEAAFPELIAPHQPFLDLRGIAHTVMPGVIAEVSFRGDIFETEDQRNWSDASFKTYCTPLALPIPVTIAAGSSVRQSVQMQVRGLSVEAKPVWTVESPEKSAVLSCGPRITLPRLGLAHVGHGDPLSEGEIEHLRQLRLDHLRFDLDPSAPNWMGKLKTASAEAAEMKTSLHVALFLADPAEATLDSVAAAAPDLSAPVVAWLIFHKQEGSTPADWVEKARCRLKPLFPEALIVAGTNAFFTELNRGPRPGPAADGVCYSVNPQVHAFDDLTILENLETLATQVECARALASGRPVVVSPVTLRPRAGSGLDSSPDPRQGSLFAASWTLASLVELSKARAFSVTYFETVGPAGVLESREEAETPCRVFPVYFLLRELRGVAAVESYALSTARKETTCGIVSIRGSRKTILLSSLSPGPQVIEFDVSLLPENAHMRLWILEEDPFAETPSPPGTFRNEPGALLEGRRFDLPPYSVAVFEVIES